MQIGKRVQVAPPLPRGGGNPLPAPLQHQMETAFGTSFSDVRVHQGHEATLLGAQSFTRGHDIHFAPGVYDPSTPSGQEMVGHELAHVVQQRSGVGSLAKGLVQL